jgi:hypothetical protein
MQPRVGLDVHYVSLGSKDGRYPQVCRAAEITEVGGWRTTAVSHHEGGAGSARTLTQVFDDTRCHLMIFNPSGQFFKECDYRAFDPSQPAGGTWHFSVEHPPQGRADG